ncbi:FtsX-like permease family protein [Natronorubrum tibetense]|nr:ABC transporter permease [Natronorubrum tibetense]
MAPNDPSDTTSPTNVTGTVRRLRRWRGRIGLAWKWVRSQGLETAPKRTWMSVIGVAMAIALLVSVTGLAVGIASPMTGAGSDSEYWIVPESESDSSALVAAGDPQFGSVHTANDRLLEYEHVESSTPLLMQVVQIESDSGASEYVVALGVIPDSASESVMGLSTAAMTPGDPYYENGSYNGTATDEVVLSNGAATLLEAEEGSDVSVSGGGGAQSFTTIDVDEGDAGSVLGTTPIAVMQLSELQTLTGAAEHDQADQFLVQTSSPSAADDFEGLYDEAEVYSSSEMTTQQVLDSDLALALSLTAILVSIFVGTLFIGTTMVFELIGNRSQLASLHAMGIGLRSQLTMYALQTIIVTIIGGLLGGVIGLLGIRLLNFAAEQISSVGAVAVGHPVFLVYGFAVALVIGLITIPFLGFALWRLDIGGERIRE